MNRQIAPVLGKMSGQGVHGMLGRFEIFSLQGSPDRMFMASWIKVLEPLRSDEFLAACS